MPTTSIHWSLGRWAQTKENSSYYEQIDTEKGIFDTNQKALSTGTLLIQRMLRAFLNLVPVNTRDLNFFTTEYVSSSAISSVANHHIFLVLGILAVDLTEVQA